MTSKDSVTIRERNKNLEIMMEKDKWVLHILYAGILDLSFYYLGTSYSTTVLCSLFINLEISEDPCQGEIANLFKDPSNFHISI